jgi:alginate O-acetyltransferase complex protein AlgI
MEQPSALHFSDWSEGGQRFLRGLVKKTCLADPLSILIVDPTFNAPADQNPTVLVLAMLAYGLQIYYDFSGYSDMAIGLGRCMGFRFPENFNYPYRSASFSEFWTRWHISLSSWLRDYLYISLGGNRSGALKTSFNLLVTMLLGGLWHGASWLFLLWGLLHGVLLIIQRIITTWLSPNICSLFPKWFSVLIVYSCVTLAWVPFRAEALNDVWVFWAAPFHLDISNLWHHLTLRTDNTILLAFAFGFHIVRTKELKWIGWPQWPIELKALIWGTIGFWLFSFYPQSNAVSPFIYFQF